MLVENVCLVPLEYSVGLTGMAFLESSLLQGNANLHVVSRFSLTSLTSGTRYLYRSKIYWPLNVWKTVVGRFKYQRPNVLHIATYVHLV